ncbi:hypothetical protein CAPTEDRAFT_145018 [Capitella teleta]|uniref:Fibrinogen C-terminal domain-containing protein n=1 Tax=Capitella teleta TaxID=283909 RepID=R7U7P5_CAPTE|nr:hypothetical protein CAPTEDRAFT_145018 [Capitella teleta]|eukprot:ELT99696.1 hypothetical protein CAPTEDRAFT_145018 [Capitella teleta]
MKLSSINASPVIFKGFCDMETTDEQWLVFQRRVDGSVDFYKGWQSYAQGFGNLETEFWLGNDNLHALTSSGYTVLRVDMSDFEGVSAYAEYNSFNVEDAAANYRMVCSGYSGNAGDSLSYSSGTQFSTFDDDNDSWGDSCASRFHGAFWYLHCHGANPNGAYLNGANTTFGKGINWKSFRGHKYSLKFIEMKLRKN